MIRAVKLFDPNFGFSFELFQSYSSPDLEGFHEKFIKIRRLSKHRPIDKFFFGRQTGRLAARLPERTAATDCRQFTECQLAVNNGLSLI